MIPVVKKFAEIDWNTLGPGLLKFGSALAVLVAAMVGLSFAGTQALAASVGLLALGAAFALLMPQMAIVAMFEWESIGKILAVFVGVLGAFTVAGLALSAVGPIFVGVAAAVSAFNLSIAAIIAALASLVKALPLAVAAFVAFSTLSSDTVQNGVENVGLFLEGLVDVIIGLKVKVKTAFLQYLSAMLEAIAEMTPDIVNGALLIVTEFLAVLDERLPEILVLLDNILTDIEPYAEKFGKHGAKIAGGFVKGLLEGLWDLLGDVVLSIGEWLDAAIMGGAGKARKQSLANVYAQQGREVSAQVAKNAHENAKTFEASVKQNQSVYKESGWLEANAYLAGSDKRMGRHSPPREVIQRVKENAETFFKESISGHNLTKFGQSGSKQADEYVKQMDTKLESDVPASASKASESFVSTTQKEAPGTKAAQEVAKEVKEDDSIEKEAAEKAKKVAEAFQTEFEKIDLNLSNVGSKFGIMEAYLGPDAKEKQLQEMQLKQLQEELELYGEKYNAAWQKYQNIQNIPNVKQAEVDKAYNEYLKVYEETAKKAAEIADLQKQMYGSYEEAEKTVFAELVDLGKARQTLISSAQTETSEATKEAYEKFATAATEEQRQYYYNLWNQMKEIDAAGIFGDILAKPIDPSEVRAEVYKQLGLDPNNPMQGFMSVTDLVNQAVQVGRTAYMTAIQENAPQVVEGYQVELANSADEIVDFVENEVAPKYRRVGEMMGEETADGIEISASRVSYSGKKMSTDAVGEVKSTTGEWKDVGVGMMQGIIDGIREMRSEVINAAVEVAQAALQAAKTVLGIASPSKAFMAVGLWAIEGLRNGILYEKGRSEEASAEVANGVVDQFGDIGYRLSRVMDESLHPVIYPSLDLTGVKRAAKNLDSIWSDRTLQTISDLSMSELDRRDELIGLRRPVAPVTNNNNNFVQNNYSPKSLSDAEIYLQTKKELDWAFKGARR